jgi:hypothetical protein
LPENRRPIGAKTGIGRQKGGLSTPFRQIDQLFEQGASALTHGGVAPTASVSGLRSKLAVGPPSTAAGGIDRPELAKNVI